MDADPELLRRFGPGELDEAESLLEEFESVSLELPLPLDDEADDEQLDSDVVTD